MSKPLRIMLLATALLLLPQIGHAQSDLAIFLKFASVFIVPTSLILSFAILFAVRKQWSRHLGLIILGALNVILSVNLVWQIAQS